MQQQTKKLPNRNQVPVKYKWAIEEVYADDGLWEADCSKIEGILLELLEYQGRLGESAATFLAFIHKEEGVQQLLSKVYFYAARRKDEDNTNSVYLTMSDRAHNLYIKVSSSLSWFMPEVLALPEERVRGYLREESELALYEHMVERILRDKPHILSSELEKLLAEAGQISQAPANIFQMLNDADIKFPSIVNESGEEVEVTKGNFIRLLTSHERRVRRDAFQALYSTYGGLKNTLAGTFAASIKQDAFFANARNFDSSLHAATFPDNVPVAVYDNLIKTVHANLDKMHRYVSLRKKALGLAELHMYDLYVPIVKDFELQIPYEKAQQTVLAALAPFGKSYQEVVQRSFNERWIDVYENQGKTSGAYSAGVYGVHPFMLLNYQDNIESMFTLTHELGHSLHTHLAQANQPFVYAGYSLFVAEVASTVHEVLLTHHLLQQTTEAAEKAYYLNNFLEGFRGTVFRQTLFAEFEREVHARSAAGQTLTPELLGDLYHELNVKYYGPDIVVDREIALEWSRIPHFYRSFYVYKYATGYSAAVALARQIIEEGEPAVTRYIEFLQSGSSAYPLEVLRRAGVDMSQPEPIQLAMNEFENIVAQLEQLI